MVCLRRGAARTCRKKRPREGSGTARALAHLDLHRHAVLLTGRRAWRTVTQGYSRPLGPSSEQLLHSRRTHARLLLALGGQERSPRGGAGGGWCGGGFRGTEGATWCAYRRREPELGDWDALWPTPRRSLQGGRRPPPRPRGRCLFCRGTRVGSSRGAGGCPRQHPHSSQALGHRAAATAPRMRWPHGVRRARLQRGMAPRHSWRESEWTLWAYAADARRS